MNFFDAQDRAKRATRWLVIVYIITTILIVAGVTAIAAGAFMMAEETGQPVDPFILVAVAVLATLLIIGATIFKISVLSSGGSRVAVDMGGTLVTTDVNDPLKRRFRNVVEEMAIASGVPAPEIYVLEEESGINAFAAGFTPGDAAIAVTRGTLELLNRDELQGVIAHEFSHILNGDMRLNIRMMGVLFGIMVLGIIGRLMLRSGYHTGRRSKNAAALMAVGVGLVVLGWIGLFAARLVKAAVSRQREFLADASAVQFTRQTDGIANALKKIGGYGSHSYIRSVDPEEISHMLFAGGVSRLTSMFATHPPLIDRIKALDAQFNEADYPVIGTQSQIQRNRQEAAADRISGFAAGAAESQPVAEAIADSVGQPDSQQIAFAAKIRQSIPAELYDAAHSSEQAWLLTLALALGRNTSQSDRQLRFVEEQLGPERSAKVRSYFGQIGQLGREYRLPLLEIAFPALRLRPAPEREYLLELVQRVIEIDAAVDLYEYCFYRVLKSNLEKAAKPSASRKGNRAGKKATRQAAIDLVGAVAHHGHTSTDEAESAYQAGITEFGTWAADADFKEERLQSVQLLDRSLNVLEVMNSAGRKSLLKALARTVSHDRKLTVTEAELLRTVCVSLDCPLPPILGK